MQQSFGQGLRDPDHPHGAQQAPSEASGASRLEEQHHKPFFYIQPSQPCLPLQWSVPMPVPVSYSPYYNYPGECRNRVESSGLHDQRSYNSGPPVENALGGITQTVKLEISVIVLISRTQLRAEAKIEEFSSSALRFA